jgi:prepilin-type N-terminal cleavage/methylation domain-containing protein/prepilin-type processing-associated H-X9-DG protein
MGARSRRTTNAETRRTWAAGLGRRPAFTLVELLVVISLIALLMALLLPAVQAARESGRRAQCRSQLHQLGVAMESHLSVYRRYPTNGWGHLWIGDPDRGTDRDQPGGWVYNLLPYMELNHLREMGQDLAPAAQRQELTNLVQVRIPILNCPTRGAPELSAAAAKWSPRNADWVPHIAKNDYAANGGDFFIESSVWEGPLTLAQGDSGQYPWTDPNLLTGVIYQRSEVRPAMILDGLSQTYLLGEKYVARGRYNTGEDEGYNESMYHGSSIDLTRWVQQAPRGDAFEIDYGRFGSAHSAGCHFLFCDGSVRLMSYDLDPEIHRRLGHRADGQTIDRW